MATTEPTPPPKGINLQGMLAIVDAYGGRAAFKGRTTEWVKQNVVLPATAPSQASYATLAAAACPHHVAPATAFISHAYDDEFLGVLDAVAALEARGGDAAYYYVDLLVVNQHGQGAVVPFATLRDEFGASVRAIGRTLAVLRWQDPIPLRRAWCVFELATTLSVGATLQVLMPPQDVEEFKEALKGDPDSLTYKTCRVNVEMAYARRQVDLDNIKRVIREDKGYLKTNQLVIGAMKDWMAQEGEAALRAADGAGERADIMAGLAGLLHSRGKLSEAEPLFREALELVERTGNLPAPKYANALAQVLFEQGNVVEAVDLSRNALASAERTLGHDHPDLLMIKSSLASQLVPVNITEAEQLLIEAVAACRLRLGARHRHTLDAIYRLACLRFEQYHKVHHRDRTGSKKLKLGEAEALFHEALDGQRLVLEETKQHSDHPATLLSISSLATVLKAKDLWGEAGLYCSEALSTRERTLGEDHPNTVISMRTMAEILIAQGKLEDAEFRYTQVLEVRKRTLGDHPDTLTSMKDLASVLQRQGKLDAAESIFREAMGLARRLLGCEHPDTVMVIGHLASVVCERIRIIEAEQCREKHVLPWWRSWLRSEPGELLTELTENEEFTHNLAVLFSMRSEAVSLLREVRKRMSLGCYRLEDEARNHTLLLADLLYAQGRLCEALKLTLYSHWRSGPFWLFLTFLGLALLIAFSQIFPDA